MKRNRINIKQPAAALLSIAYLLSLSFLKYKLNGVSINHYNPYYIGNILNILITFGIVVGFIVLAFKKNQLDNSRTNFLLILSILAQLCLLIIYVLSELIGFDPSAYLFSFPVKKVYIGFLFIVSAFVQLYVLIYVWGVILGFEKLFELRTLFRTISSILILLIFSLFVVWNVKKYSVENLRFKKYEYALIPGAAVWSKAKPSPIFEGRIRKAYELYRQGIIEKIIVSGGNAPGEITEAEAASKFLTNLGVDKKDLVIDNETSTTNEQIKFLRLNSGVSKSPTPVVIVSDNFHLTRILQICDFFEAEAEGISSGHTLTIEKTLFYRTRESVALLLFWLFAI
ncbi:MAG: YdcF family protein [Ignavibacteriales bacterium]|nr:YdcF family protein [Ignavibacteriales bacterium]